MIKYEVHVYASGTKSWYLEGKLHRTDGPAVEWADGTKEWYLEGKLHRTDGPAFEYANGSKEWFFEGKLNRTDGPAIEWANGSKQWYLEGKQLSEAEFNLRMNPQPSCAGKIVEIDGKKYRLEEA